MLKFESDTFIKEMESIKGVKEAPLDYEEFEIQLNNQHEEMTERDLRGGL